jgi:uncharacterized membrane protein
LIIHILSGASRIHKVQILSHHFKIATKIDVYNGILKDAQDVLQDIIPDTPPSDDEDNMLIEFTRLGLAFFFFFFFFFFLIVASQATLCTNINLFITAMFVLIIMHEHNIELGN